VLASAIEPYLATGRRLNLVDPAAVTAGDEIRNLLGLYCDRIDAGDFADVGSLFEHGALADESGNELARGRRPSPRSTRPARSGTTGHPAPSTW
jgi:hypothetical protein